MPSPWWLVPTGLSCPEHPLLASPGQRSWVTSPRRLRDHSEVDLEKYMCPPPLSTPRTPEGAGKGVPMGVGGAKSMLSQAPALIRGPLEASAAPHLPPLCPCCLSALCPFSPPLLAGPTPPSLVSPPTWADAQPLGEALPASLPPLPPDGILMAAFSN